MSYILCMKCPVLINPQSAYAQTQRVIAVSSVYVSVCMCVHLPMLEQSLTQRTRFSPGDV